MSDVKQIFGIRESSGMLVRPERQSIEQTEDYAFKQVIHTKELYVNGAAIAGAGNIHEPTTYRGTDFAGVNPNKTLTHSRTLPVSMQLFIGGRMMIRTVEYTIAGAVISMVDVTIDDDDYVVVCD